ncbi:hypothetical protein CNR22_12295 [Sphingobacteriaceae bacterium]|nr:hypothetical protein CNR22_12295 [Sphingobacteriaceae bacterium]
MLLNNQKNLLHYISFFLMPCLHLLILFLVYKLFLLSGFITVIDPFYLKKWDAGLYATIAEHGYKFEANKAGNTAFFPLFPYTWKVLWKIFGAGVEGLCIYNFIAFSLGMLILKKTLDFSWWYFLFFISIPSNIFMYVPYSEATFFFFSALVLAGLKSSNKPMVVVGLFFASMTRPSGAFFIPAIFAMELLLFEDIKSFLKNVLIYSGVIVLAVIVVFAFQYYATGVWLVFFKDGWSRQLSLPEFPLTSWGGLKHLWLDGTALFFGLLAFSILCILLYNKFKRKKNFVVDRVEVFSLTYVMMALITILLFGGKDPDGGTSLLSLNRFLMATPFFTVMLYFLSHRAVLNYKSLCLYTSVGLLTLFSLNLRGTGYSGFSESSRMIFVLLVFTLFMLFIASSKKFGEKYLPALYLINVGLQIMLLHRFAYAGWVG